jgi:C4-dicarboxylate-specific signal transduction histidine kinase
LANASVLILTDETEFARIVSGCWQAQRKAPDVTVLNSGLWRNYDAAAHDLVIVGPVSSGKLHEVLCSLDHASAIILCIPTTSREYDELRSRYPRFLHVQQREDWSHTLLLVAGEALRRVEAHNAARQAEQEAARIQHLATLGRYMTDMKHSMNNALTSMLGNAELMLLEPGQLSTQSLAQIRTIHSMAMRINEIMVRFSTLASEMREAENASQAETEAARAPAFPSR